jgi:hypothetical protein
MQHREMVEITLVGSGGSGTALHDAVASGLAAAAGLLQAAPAVSRLPALLAAAGALPSAYIDCMLCTALHCWSPETMPSWQRHGSRAAAAAGCAQLAGFQAHF